MKCKNKCKIEASIAESYILEEVSNFTTKYYGDNLPSVYNPPPRYNAGDNEEWCRIMLYVLISLSEVEPYIA